MTTALVALVLVLAPGVGALVLLPLLQLRPALAAALARRRVDAPAPLRLPHLGAGAAWMGLGVLLLMLPPLLRWQPTTLLHDLQALALIPVVILAAALAPGRAPARVAAGALIALALLALVSLLQLAGPAGPRPAPLEGLPGLGRLAELSRQAADSGRASGWLDHPNLWATTGLVPGLFLLALPAPRWRLAAALPAALIALASGSRAALLGLALGVALLGLGRLRARAAGRRELALAALALAAALTLVFAPPWGARVLGLFDAVAPATPAHSYNLFAASEVLTDPVWTERGVEVLPGSANASWTIRKLGESSAERLLQRVELAPGGHYTLSVELRSRDRSARPGLFAFWRDDAGVAHGLAVRRVDGAWSSNVRGELELVSFAASPLADGWVRLELVVRNRSTAPVELPIGPAPDQRLGSGGEIEVRRPQLAAGAAPLPYQPTFAPERERLQAQSSAQGRGRILAAAWQGFLARPLLGHGDGAFPDWFRSWSGNDAVTIGHAHDLLLQTLFARGLLGLLGLALLLLGLAVAARGSAAFLVVLAAVLAANVFDATFWSASQSYLLAVAAGWYAGRSLPRAAAPSPRGRVGP